MTKGTIDMPESWWKLTKKKIPVCGKFKEKGLQNEAELMVMFEDLRNTGDEHFCASSGVALQSSLVGAGGVEGEADSNNDSEPEEVPPPTKYVRSGDKEKGKRLKTSGAM